MRVLYVCRPVDEAAPFTAAQIRWITALAHTDGVEHVSVLTTHYGRASLPPNVTVQEFAGRTWPRRAVSFWREVVRAAPGRHSFFFVAQGGPYPALLLPFKVVCGRPIYQWKAQPHVSRKMRFYVRHCNNLVFTATEQSLLVESGKKRVIGHGIDTTAFSPRDAPLSGDFLTVGRLSKIKRIDRMVRALEACRRLYGVNPRLDIVGRPGRKGEDYVAGLRRLAADLGVEGQVRFLGHVDNFDLPDLFCQYRASLNFSATAFDKSVGESMACGVPAITSNECVLEDLPSALRPQLSVDPTDVEKQAAGLFRAMSWDAAARKRLGERVRAYVISHHSLDNFFARIICEIERERSGRVQPLV